MIDGEGEGDEGDSPQLTPPDATEATVVGGDAGVQKYVQATETKKSPVHTLLRNILARALELGNTGCHTVGVEPVDPSQN